ncbi:MAG: hypothetical protein JJU42_16110 [Rhodobacteraceae bacterium]|nr:hypothetical protein [Paracoccaceae bacterium]
MRNLMFAAALTAFAAPALAFDGLYRPGPEWGGDSWDCETVGMDGGAIAVQGDRFIGVENFCTLSDPVDVRGMDAVLYDATCEGEGETYTYRMMLHRTFDGIAVISEGVASNLIRCE